ncbi:Protein CBG18876 [Caenorhabditis briggsae]|uniref:Protein CBG18876 n=1 Tax=Caenorhabditis briggsae TaxID=6238 RepID=A8XU94_CAEBR|nr:Protein CBG18876 [Caenorhabditis briggsae]CAP36219.2 Protein CBG18876 [Caenorhabditis briggsae]
MSSDFADYSVKNYYSIRKNNPLLPSSIRACIIGKSGCGKTNLLMNLLLDKFEGDDYLDYDSLYIFSTTLFQPCYQALINGFQNGLSKKDIRECFKNQNFMVEKKDKQEITIHTSDSLDDIPDPSSIDPNKKTLIIFDDLMLEKQNKIEQYYTRGRHNNIDCFYISQSYIKLPKNTIRENANLFIVFPQDKLNLDYIYRDHCSELDKERFLEMSSEIWKEKFSFLIIDKTSEACRNKHSKIRNDDYERESPEVFYFLSSERKLTDELITFDKIEKYFFFTKNDKLRKDIDKSYKTKFHGGSEPIFLYCNDKLFCNRYGPYGDNIIDIEQTRDTTRFNKKNTPINKIDFEIRGNTNENVPSIKNDTHYIITSEDDIKFLYNSRASVFISEEDEHLLSLKDVEQLYRRANTDVPDKRIKDSISENERRKMLLSMAFTDGLIHSSTY